VAVRDAEGLASTDIGTSLMRKAFDKATGPLTNRSQPESEPEALAHLFAELTLSLAKASGKRKGSTSTAIAGSRTSIGSGDKSPWTRKA
jgi:hypothetical protein